MNQISKLIDRIFTPVKHLPAGIYHMQAADGPSGPYRMHLRLEEDGEGILIVNASTVLHLNRTAAEYAYYMVKGIDEVEVWNQMATRYNIAHAQVKEDYAQFKERLNSLIQTPDL